MAGRKSVHKKAVEALLSDDLSALNVGDGDLFDVAFEGIRQHQQRRDAPKGKSKRQPWADELAEMLAAAHPDLLTEHFIDEEHLFDAEFYPQEWQEQVRRFAGFEVWVDPEPDEKGRWVLRAEKHGQRPRRLTVSAFKRGYLGPAHRRVKARRGRQRPG